MNAFPSLTHQFEAPDGYIGQFGWLCGYSADAGFLDAAAERFTRETAAVRAHRGRIALALMLDSGHPHISLKDMAGVAHLPINNPAAKPFALLHAKIALLAFRHEQDATHWQLRLIVTTGNWTRQTLEESVDLVWRVELYSQDLAHQTIPVHQAVADIRAAWHLLQWLRNFFDTRILDALPDGRQDSETSIAGAFFESCLAEALSRAGFVKPRFFDNRSTSLLEQLPVMIRATGKSVRRNCLAMGSGFYEGLQPSGDMTKKQTVPAVLSSVLEVLRSNSLLTQRATVDVFVNPEACQAVASSLEAMADAGLTVRPPGIPACVYGGNAARTLHAKFIFSANHSPKSNFCNSAWLYLGSGNLTHSGFTRSMSPNRGNLEAGVVFAPEQVYWNEARNIDPAHVITALLPVQWDRQIEFCASLSAGTELPIREAEFVAAPVAWLLWYEVSGQGRLKAPDGAVTPFDILSENDIPCLPDGEGGFIWQGHRPRQVCLRWSTDGTVRKTAVPVMDQLGRIAAIRLPQIDLDEVWWQLASFPAAPWDDGSGSEEGATVETAGGSAPLPALPVAAYPIRQMMQLLENLAARQTGIALADWPAWCIRLEQVLIQASHCPVLQTFTDMEINPLSPLWQAPFRPAFAETAATAAGQRYETVLRKIETHWNVASLARLGEL